jgi:hypothetical protein
MRTEQGLAEAGSPPHWVTPCETDVRAVSPDHGAEHVSCGGCVLAAKQQGTDFPGSWGRPRDLPPSRQGGSLAVRTERQRQGAGQHQEGASELPPRGGCLSLVWVGPPCDALQADPESRWRAVQLAGTALGGGSRGGGGRCVSGVTLLICACCNDPGCAGLQRRPGHVHHLEVAEGHVQVRGMVASLGRAAERTPVVHQSGSLCLCHR